MLAIRQRPGIEPLSFGYMPNFFAGIEFGRITGQVMQRQPLSVSSDKVFDSFRTVSGSPIDNQEQFSPKKMTMKRLQEPNERFGIEIVSGELKEHLSLTAYRRGDSYMNATLTRDANNRLETGESPSFAYMRDQNKEAFVAIEENSSRPSARAENTGQNLLFPFAYCLGILLQGARLGNLLHKPHPVKESWHVLGMQRNTEQFSDQNSDTRPSPQVRAETVSAGRVMQDTYKLGEMRRFEFRLGSRSLGGSQSFQTRLPKSMHPSEDRGTIEPHGMSDVFDTDSTSDHPYHHETHLFQGLMTDGITVDSSGGRHTDSISWNPSKVYLIMLHNIEGFYLIRA